MTLFKIPGGQSYKPFDATIPADFSTATFPAVAAAVTGSKIKIKNLDFNDQQGDKEIFNVLEKMGMKVVRKKAYTEVSINSKLKGMEIDLNSTPDALPAMAVAACFAEGKTLLGNVPQARIKGKPPTRPRLQKLKMHYNHPPELKTFGGGNEQQGIRALEACDGGL
jgi:3-phosphoshikimate 1-carboxyvinyltransferase